jgi:hypothetical protein
LKKQHRAYESDRRERAPNTDGNRKKGKHPQRHRTFLPLHWNVSCKQNFSIHALIERCGMMQNTDGKETLQLPFTTHTVLAMLERCPGLLQGRVCKKYRRKGKPPAPINNTYCVWNDAKYRRKGNLATSIHNTYCAGYVGALSGSSPGKCLSDATV